MGGFRSTLLYFILRDLLVYWKSILIIVTPIVLLPLILSLGSTEAGCAYTVILMAVFWIGEVVPLAVTAMFPIFLYPMIGVLDSKTTCAQYLSDSNFLYVGGIMVALAVEEVNLHKRIALRTLLLVGSSPSWLMLGFMVITGFLSMWMSNTATTAMMMPIAMAVCEELIRFTPTAAATYGDSPSSLQKGPGSVPSYGSVTPVVNGMDTDKQTMGNSESNAPPSLVLSVRSEEDVEPPKAKQPPALPFTHKSRFPLLSRLDQNSTRAVLLCIAYSANIGGTATITGTGPNIVSYGDLELFFKNHSFPNSTMQVSFGSWMGFALPGMIICQIMAWLWLQFYFLGPRTMFRYIFGISSAESKRRNNAVRTVLRRQYAELGNMSFGEWEVLLFFVLLVMLWIFRDPQFIHGWHVAFKPGYVSDAVTAMFIASILFLLPKELPDFIFFPNRDKTKKPRVRTSVLTWDVIKRRFPWDVILLLGGGFAMAAGVDKSGLSQLIGSYLHTRFASWSPKTVCCLSVIIVTFLTEIASNAATASIFIPILLALASSLNVHYLYFSLPATLACSYAFMLPVSTPPNAIVYGSGIFRVVDMIKVGFILEWICIAVNLLGTFTWTMAMFHLNEVPDWQTAIATTTVATTVNATAITTSIFENSTFTSHVSF